MVVETGVPEVRGWLGTSLAKVSIRLPVEPPFASSTTDQVPVSGGVKSQ